MDAPGFDEQDLTVCAVCGKKEPCTCFKDFKPAPYPKKHKNTFGNARCRCNPS
jgi:hypothetical protein